MGHAHQAPPAERTRERRSLLAALVANAVLLVAEVAGGFAFRSLTLLADAAHLLVDVSALGIALVAFRLAERPATPHLTFGLQRVEVLAAQANALILLGASGWIVAEAVPRLGTPAAVHGAGLVGVAAAGLAVNVGSAYVLLRTQGRSLGMRSAVLHLGSDALGSLGAVLAGVLVLGWGLRRADPVAAIFVAALVLVAVWRLLRDAIHVLLEGTPQGLDVPAVERAILHWDDVEGVHHLHVWSLASDVPALSAHVVLRAGQDVSLHDAQARGEGLKEMLGSRFGIHHVTLELECHGGAAGGAANPV